MEKEMNIHQRIASIKKELHESPLKKSGHNKYAGFKYHELADFLPRIVELNAKYQINDTIEITRELAHLHLSYNNDKVTITVPFADAEMLGKGGTASSVDAIQRLGATITYLRRYLYLTAYGIVENDVVDSQAPTETETPAVSTKQQIEQRAKMIAWLYKEVPDETKADEILTTALKLHDVKDIKSLDFNKVKIKDLVDTLTAEIKKLNPKEGLF